MSKRTDEKPSRSEHVDRFNHDDEAAGYDRDVQNEANPIRAGYDDLLTWVAAQVPPGATVVDLGSGTGNLAARLETPRQIIAVDVSEKMIEVARAKLADAPVRFVRADLLECFDQLDVVDAFVSTYAIHHLTASEKRLLFQRCWDHLRPGGRAVFGDLMFENAEAEAGTLAAFARAGKSGLVEDIGDEFFWDLDAARLELESIGFVATHRRFSTLSWGVLATRGL